MATELTKEQKKALRKAKFKNFLKIAGLCTGSAAIAGVVAYFIGKEHGETEGIKLVSEEPGFQLVKDIVAYDAMETYNNKLLYLVENGKFATEFTNDETGEKKYMTYLLSNDAPDWWDDKGVEKFDLKAKVLDGSSL